ncbi:Glutathione hydrolase 1 proenzyme [Frankliniella fusca]|uniref:Glutathione hydrolase 1 proenzyme n=1 Tax=Frankliniella fusca TaxID=407009 RepID=A0AAE1GT28_9NEOP|nr:Glutathione hydrolase 1 proenzyme [Frankliniella fusca]
MACNVGDFKRRYVVLALLLGVVGLGVLVGFTVRYVTSVAYSGAGAQQLVPPNPEVPPPPSASVHHVFKRGAVCADGAPCSAVGREILQRNGSAVDAAIAALFCNGIVNSHSMGLGGGFQMVIYSAKDKKAHVLDAREAAPLASHPNMFRTKEEAQVGPRAACVPGELRGYWEAHKRFGRLRWSDLIAPSIKICRNGYVMTMHQYQSLSRNKLVKVDSTLREIFIDPKTGEFRRAGTLVKLNRLCDTLQTIADEGGDVLYNGTLADVFARDLLDLGSFITKDDLQLYRPRWREPVSVELQNGIKFYSVPPPGSGALLAFVLSFLDGYGFSSKSMADVPSAVTTYHRIVESFKYAYGFRTKLGDPDFVDLSEDLKLLTSRRYADELRRNTPDNSTSTDFSKYGGVYFNPPDAGTAHISVISEDGDAVSVTSTIDIYFGAGVTSPHTGITLSSGMDDFSWENFRNYFGLPGSPSNAVAPQKRPLSSMSPSILVDRHGDVRLVVGASGGTKIPTAIANVIIRHLWFEESIKEAVDAPRIHHQLFPMEISYEFGIIDQIIQGLEKLGHKTSRYRNSGSVACAIGRVNKTITANADFRKGGEVFGY